MGSKNPEVEQTLQAQAHGRERVQQTQLWRPAAKVIEQSHGG